VAGIRRATARDAAAIADLMQLKRLRYAAYQPTFWRVAPDAAQRQRPFLRELLGRPDTIAFVEESAEDCVTAALIARVAAAPGVYAPGGATLDIDDFWVVDERAWETTGRALLDRAAQEAGERFGAVQVVVVCAQLDEPKRAMLRSAGLTVASEWWTRPL